MRLIETSPAKLRHLVTHGMGVKIRASLNKKALKKMAMQCFAATPTQAREFTMANTTGFRREQPIPSSASCTHHLHLMNLPFV